MISPKPKARASSPTTKTTPAPPAPAARRKPPSPPGGTPENSFAHFRNVAHGAAPLVIAKAESSLRKVESACSELRNLQYWFGFAHFLTQVPMANISIQHEDRHLPSSERSVRSFGISAASNEFIEGLTNLLKEERARVAARIAELEARMATWE